MISNNPDFPEVIENNGNVSNPVLEQSCDICGKSSMNESFEKIIIKNSDSTRGNISRTVCMSCIHSEISKLCKKEKEQVIQNNGNETELQISRSREPKFRGYIFEKLSKKEDMKWEYSDAVYSGAEAVGLSSKTTRKYLNKLCSSEGILKIICEGKKSYIKYKLDKLMLDEQLQELTGDDPPNK